MPEGVSGKIKDSMTKFRLNGKAVTADVAPKTPLLWTLRDHFGLTGTKYGCGLGLCGACTVLIDGKAVRSCVTPTESVAGREIVTIEGLSRHGTHPLQKAWQELSVPQCGYCQPGQIMQAAALLKDKPRPTDREIEDAMQGNICRCGTYQRIRQGIKLAAGVKP